MKEIKIFDVVELNNNDKATVLNYSGDHYLVQIAGKDKRNTVVNIKDIKNIIYTK